MNLGKMNKYACDEVVDAVVIGTGAGGAPLLWRLAAKGLKAVALEAGRNWTPGEDFATDELAAAELYWLGERLSSGSTPEAFGANNSGTGVGGSTLHWGAFVPRTNQRDLRMHSTFQAGVDWPMNYADLVPYYESVEAFIGVSGPDHYPWDSSRHYTLPPVALNAPAQMMQKGFAEIGMRTSHAPVAAVSRDYAQPEYPLRHACVNRGYCHQGCRNGAKASMDVTYLPAAVGAGAEIRANSFVSGFERDSSGRISAVIYNSGGVERRQRCSTVFLCAGAIETPRLLLHTGIANSSGQVGRNYMAHVATQVWGTFEETMRPNKGFPASMISEDPIHPEDADFAGGYLVQSLGIVPVTWAMQVARGRTLWGEPLVKYLDQYNHVAGLGVNGDCLPDERNYLELSDEVDDSGLPKPVIHFSYGENEKRMSMHAAKLMSAAWEAVGATDIWSFERSAHTHWHLPYGHRPRDVCRQ